MDIQKQEFNRNRTFDIAKGLGIIFMVYCHAIEVYNHGFTFRFFYLFHMAFFFILSGYFFKEKYALNFESVKNFITKRFKSLLIPYLFFNLLFLFLHNIFLQINFLPSSQIFFDNLKTVVPLQETIPYYSASDILKHFLWVILLGKEELFVGTTWFLKVLFFISSGYLIGFYLINKLKISNKYKEFIKLTICILCLLVGYFLSLKDIQFYKIGTMLSCAILYHIGTLFNKQKVNFNQYLVLIITTILLVIINIYNPKFFYISRNFYNNPLWFLSASILGYFWVISIAKILNFENIISKIICYIGQNTIPILCLHLISFKIVTICEIIYLQEPVYMLQAYETYYTNHFELGIVYTIVGISVPLCINSIYQKIKNTFNKHLLKQAEQTKNGL